MIRYLIALVGLLFVSGLAAAGTQPNVAHLIDDMGLDIVAQFVCDVKEGGTYQISKISTVDKLLQYLKNLPEDHKYRKCFHKYHRAIEQFLDLVVTSESLDVCSKEQIDKIISFHRNFISETDNDIFNFRNGVAPSILVQFFLHYAYQISDICKQRLLEHFESAAVVERNSLIEERVSDMKELDRIFSTYNAVMGGLSGGSLKTLDDVGLLWSLAERAPFGDELEYFTEPTAANGYTIATVASGDSDKIIRVQQECRGLKPLYESPVLSVLRLIDFGYYLKDERFAKEFATRPNLKRLFTLVVICESFLPIIIVQDDSLKPGEGKLLKTEKAKNLGYHVLPVDKKVIEPPFSVDKEKFNHNTIANLDQVPTVTVTGAKPFVEDLMSTIRFREKIFRRIMRGFVTLIKQRIKKFFGDFISLFKKQPKQKKHLYPFDALPIFELLA